MRTQLASWLSFFLCYFTCLTIHFSSVSGRCLDDQKSLLVQMKNKVTFDPVSSSKLLSWNPHVEADCCKWKGVFCDNEGRVTGLDLSLDYISGELGNSNSLFSLQNLQNLNLAFNSFSSVIPSGFHQLTNFTYLNLSSAGFGGQIPIEISYLTRLVVFDISSSYYLVGSTLKLENPNLGKFVKGLTQVRELYLDGVDVSQKGNEWCRALSSSLLHLQVLSMSSCKLTGPIDSSLQNLKNLSMIRLNENDFSGPVPEFFTKFSNLTTLHLSSCGLNGIFPQDIFEVQTLTSLDVSYNNGLHGSLPDFPQNGSLQSLILSNTSFSGALPDSISNLRNLSRLECSNCQFNGALSDSLSKLTELTYLDLSYNNLTGPIPSFGMPIKLAYIDLSFNHLSGEVSSSHFEGLQSLVSLDLRSNSLNGSVPSSLFLLASLQKILLPSNQFAGELNEISVLHNSALATIDLSSNNLEGPIPMSIFHLSSLHVLQLSSNKFNGTMHLDVIRSLKNLTTLDLSYNNLSIDVNAMEADLYSYPNIRHLLLASCKLSKFPVFLRNQSMLFSLDLSNNQIQGRIPNWIWGLGALSNLNLSNNFLNGLDEPLPSLNANILVLDLHSNKLEGKIPVIPQYVTYLDYSSNKFNSFPHDIGIDLPLMIFLSLSNNSFHGSIPNYFCSASNLQVLDLSHNKFNGSILQCIAEREGLRVLNLRDNMFNGNIPDRFSESCALKTLDLHGNQLSGPLPKSLANCKTLEVLDLGRNHINDVFPFLLMNIQTLRVIVLRENKFRGPIGCPTMIGSWQMLQIVDLAFNSFSGKLPRQCFTRWKAMMLDEDKAASQLDHIKFQVLQFGHQIYYQDSVTVTFKGLQMQLVKILNVFTSIDFSSNHFEGPIPGELMNFKALYFLNLSYNSLSGQIPSSIGNLRQLESLDLSYNSLAGEIPKQLGSLSFLSFLNLSFNDLEGTIPTGNQIQTFEATSFKGNQELCGPPLTKNCSSGVQNSNSATENPFSWNFISSELGFIFGIGMIFLPLLFWKRWRLWYWKFINGILYHIFPQLDFVNEWDGRKSYRTLRWKSR